MALIPIRVPGAVALIGAVLAVAPKARAQSSTVEAVLNAGASSEQNITVAATQVRTFGEVASIRYFGELLWGRTSDPTSDAFGAAYPYENRVQVGEAYGERAFTRGAMVVGVRAGRFRPPFGIYNASEHAYTGFLRAPLLRYDNYFSISNDFLEHGATVFGGIPQLSGEVSIGAPADIGSVSRRSNADTVLRLQTSSGSLIVGVSHIRTTPYQPDTFAFGPAIFTGVDVHWMHAGLQLRGEWLGGRPFDGVTTTGWYADAMLHRPSMGRVTALARVERLDYDTPVAEFVLHTQRETVGARLRVLDTLSVNANLLHTSGSLHPERAPMAVDVAISYTLRGDLVKR
jgi:hypothetical protein